MVRKTTKSKAKPKAKPEIKEENPVGRPPLFKTALELQSKIDEYFSEGVKSVEILYGSAKDGVHRESVKAPNSAHSPYKYFGGILVLLELDSDGNVVYEYRGEK